MKKLEYHVLSHTHWDREWYRTFQQFRKMLVHLLDELLDILDQDPDFKHFHLDGQTIVLEDYLAIRPENEKRLKHHIKAGRISIGPWYLLNDTYLTHAESTIRNLYIGHKVSGQFGKPCKVGYLPDQFGNISQLPQILKGFGISHVLFGRGYNMGEQGDCELEWKSPNGSKVFALFLPAWYNNFQRPSANIKEAKDQLEQVRDKLLIHQKTPYLLLMNGCDHLNVQPEIGQIIKQLNSNVKDAEVIHTQLEPFLKKVSAAAKKSKPRIGEFRDDHNHQILAGTLSTRVYLKQANNRCESKMLNAETLMMTAALAGYSYDPAYLEVAWKLLLQNHPHDSICGCSLDQVHKEMMPRFVQVEQMADVVIEESLEHLSNRLNYSSQSVDKNRGILVINPVAISRREVLEIAIDFPLSKPQRAQNKLEITGKIPKNINIMDEQGQPVPFEVINQEQTIRQLLSRNNLPHSQIVERFHVQMPLELSPSQYRSFEVIPRKGKHAKAKEVLKGGKNRLENNLVQVMIAGDGSISLRDKTNGHLYGPLLVFDDGGDVGDEYLYRTPINDRSVSTKGRPAQIKPILMTPFQGTLQVERIMPIPTTVDLKEEFRVRTTVDCVISTRITLKAQDPTLYVETRMDNKALFHRLRVLFNGNFECSSAFADSPYDIIERPKKPPAEWSDASHQFPLRSFVAIDNEDHGLAILTRGLHEYELLNTEKGILALTLLRSVGHLSRGTECHYSYDTPEAQCLGVQRFEYAFHPYHGSKDRKHLPRVAEVFNRPYHNLEFPLQNGELPRQSQIASVSPEEVIISVIKRCEERNSVLIRLVNTASEKLTAELQTTLNIKEVYQLDLLEKRKTKIKINGNSLATSLKQKEIQTLELVVE